MLKPMFTTDFPEAVFREGAGEQMKKVHCARSLTPRMWKTKDGSHRSWMRTGTPSAIYNGVEGAEWETTYYKYIEQKKLSNVRILVKPQKGHSTVVF